MSPAYPYPRCALLPITDDFENSVKFLDGTPLPWCDISCDPVEGWWYKYCNLSDKPSDKPFVYTPYYDEVILEYGEDELNEKWLHESLDD